VLLFVCLWPYSRAQATYIDINFLSISDTFKTASTTTISRTTYDLGIGYELGKSDSLIWALSYGAGTFSDATGSSKTTFTFTDLGLRLGYFITKQKSWFASITYNLNSIAKYNDGTSEVELRGTSTKADVGYVFRPTDAIGVAAKIIYYAPTYKESVASTTLTKVNYTRAIVYPGLSLSFLF
jgi:hypothetical protein